VFPITSRQPYGEAVSRQAFVPRPRRAVVNAVRTARNERDRVRPAKVQAGGTTEDTLHRELCRVARHVHHHAGYMAMLGLAPDGLSFTEPVATLLALTEDLVAAAVACDRAAGLDWFEIGRSLGLTARAARSYFSHPRERRRAGELRPRRVPAQDGDAASNTTTREGPPAAATAAPDRPALPAKATPAAAKCATIVPSIVPS
jgi:hypothetical protein